MTFTYISVVCKKLTVNRKKIVVKLLDGTTLVLFFSVFVHLLTCRSTSSVNMTASAAMVIITAAFACKPFISDSDSRRRLWAVLSALAGGFWIFCFFRYIGLVEWPLAYATDLAGYARLLYFHFVLSITVLTPVLAVAHINGTLKIAFWRNWTKGFFAYLREIVLLLSLVGCWLWALYAVSVTKLHSSGPIAGFIVVCLLKASLTGATEEICYRGVIQPTAIAHFGIPLGLIVQSCLYTAFHIHLGEAFFFSRIGFLAAVLTLGMVFGVVTHFTRGIGWATVAHIAINVVIEWRNLS